MERNNSQNPEDGIHALWPRGPILTARRLTPCWGEGGGLRMEDGERRKPEEGGCRLVPDRAGLCRSCAKKCFSGTGRECSMAASIFTGHGGVYGRRPIRFAFGNAVRLHPRKAAYVRLLPLIEDFYF